jgi:putative Holliday junction resolvase
MSRWLAVDHGHKRIGIASGDTETALAMPLTVLQGLGDAAARRRIADLARDHGADGIVVGWPLNMDETEGPQGQIARAFAAALAAEMDIDVRLWDERLSSFQADAALAGQFTRLKRRARQDAVAAAAFLQDFLDRNGPTTAPTPGEAGTS